MRLCDSFLPQGIDSKNLLSFIQLISSLASHYEIEYHNEYCLLLSRILSKVVKVGIPRNDFNSIQQVYHLLLVMILECNDNILSLCISNLISFITSYPGDVNSVIQQPELIEKIRGLLQRLQEEKEKQYQYYQLENLQMNMNEFIKQKKERMMNISKQIERMEGMDDKNNMNEIVSELRSKFDVLKSVLKDNTSVNGVITKQEANEWKQLIDQLFPFFFVCYGNR